MLYQIQDGTVSPGGETVLSHFYFEIKGREKIALVGKNGAGKTTLLRLIAGELELDRDDSRQNPGIVISRKPVIGYLPQQVFAGEEQNNRTVEEELLDACPCKDTWDRERFLYEQEYDRLFTGFGFAKEDKKKRLSQFSGGQRMRIALIRLMLSRPDILLLDEPTNHLDEEMTRWLEEWVSSYEKAVVMVSHDRFFLDRTAEVVYEITDRKTIRYSGNYSAFVQEKKRRTKQLLKAWEQQQEEVARLDELIKKFRNKPRKAAFARSRQKILDRMEKLEKPSGPDTAPFVTELVPQVRSAKNVLEVEDLQPGYEKHPVLFPFSLRIRRGQKIAVIGPNGAGKTTFLKTAAQILPPVAGTCLPGQRVEIGYFDQQTASFQAECSVLEHFQEKYPALTQKEVRRILKRWLFGEKEAARRVSDLSGGEKSRLIFAELFQSCPNFLILDEPVNHMDIQAREVLESALQAYQGTLLFVSHDRYFISKVAQNLLVLPESPDRPPRYYPFDYAHYLRKCRQVDREQTEGTKETDSDEHALGMSLEDKALLEGMRRVPEEEKGRFRRISTEEAYRDWKRRLMEEELDGLEQRVEQLEKERQEEEEVLLCLELGYETSPVETAPPDEALETSPVETAPLEEALENWTQACLRWDEFFGGP